MCAATALLSQGCEGIAMSDRNKIIIMVSAALIAMLSISLAKHMQF